VAYFKTLFWHWLNDTLAS